MTLHETLWKLTVDHLRYRLLFLVPGTKTTRKADRIDGINAALSGPGLLAAWNTLDEIGRLAVIEAVHDPGHLHHPMQFRSRYGCDASFHLPPNHALNRHSWRSTDHLQFLPFFYPAGADGSLFIPGDLAAPLRAIMPAPSRITMPCIPEPLAQDGLWGRHTESDALAEMGALLR